MMKRSRLLAALVLVSSAVVGLTACAAGGSSGGEDASVGQALVEGAAGEEDAGTPDSSVVITGRIIVVASDPIAAATEATNIVTEAGGRVSGRTEHAAEQGRQASAELTLRVPADALDEVRSSLSALGAVQETSLDSVEVGDTQRDLNARATTLRTSITRYTEWLGVATTAPDLIDLESAIADRQTELEGLEAQLREMEDQVSMSTVTLSLQSEYVPPQTAPRDLGEALAVGWNGFAAFWAGALIAVGVGLPWLVLLGAIVVFVIWLSIRRRRKNAHAPQLQPPLLHAPLFDPPAAPVPPPH